MIISPLSEKVGRYCFAVRRQSVGRSVSLSDSDISSYTVERIKLKLSHVLGTH
jgi:hypothetical protein